MNTSKCLLGRVKTLAVTFAVATSIGACASLPGSGNASWKEELLLHDGQTLIVDRSQKYGGYSEPASRERQLVEEVWRFSIPGTSERVTWKNDYGRTRDSSNLMLLRLDFLSGTPYLAASPAGCIAYNKWKRPNPPYVFFKWEGKTWKQIPINELPVEFVDANVTVGRPDTNHRTGTLSVATIKEENRHLEVYLRSILRTVLTKERITAMCEERILYKGHWIRPDDPVARQFIDQQIKQ